MFCCELWWGNSDWFVLWCDDCGIDDEMWVEGVKCGNFCLYLGMVFEGCIIIVYNFDFVMIWNVFMNILLVQVFCICFLMVCGWVEVVVSGFNNVCL